MKATKLTARGLAYVVRAVGRKIAKAHRAKQTPHGKQTVKKLMAHGTSTNSLELSGDTKLFDRVARKWNVDYAFYQTEPGKYLLFFKSGQADAMTACFSEYSRKVLDKAKSRQPTIPEQMKQAEQQLAKEKPQKEHIKEAVHLELEKEKVSLAEKEKIDFLRTASHELKTPVTELNATLENMILGIGEYRDYETYLPKCKEITEQLGDMIRDILNASRLQTQGNNEPCSNFSLRTLLTELCEPYRLIAEAKGIKFKIELSSDAFVYLPEGRLKKAISNILSNAVNYTEAGQSISVVFDKNKLSVSNECSVLPPEQLQHIFEPFYRPDLAHSQATGGNGLGLYIVQTILDKLRLKYQFVPMPNDRGMSFTIQF